ncbi:acetate--CoA ligase [Caldivirga maquilingensis]|uniref:Acetate--CoA ligase n=1 Tax=Caldivirga maquilingensis (strain ATCC 700844 / DSM 13496 / JCM 10307 / IC-167) TaxID=397948 RepID=A8MAR8_CALMQ|nr:acetate--CoA ligase [Caldivirga maquilingensis]ABW01104.1 acetate--CoA ligase [Caldivirga maquilingensis IC-167]
MSISEENLPYKEKIELKSWPNSTDIDSYRKMHGKSLENIEEHWANVAKELDWFKPWDKVLVADPQPPFYKWFVGGKLNASYLAVDRHANTWRRNKLAIIWEGEPTDSSGNPLEVRKLTYYDLYREVNRLAYAIRSKLGLRKGDTVTIYLPMIPELPILMLALARLGVIFSVVFSGFSAQALADRVMDAKSKVIFTADAFWRRGKVVRLKEVVDEALKGIQFVEKVVVFRRMGLKDTPMVNGRDIWWDELLSDVPMNTYVKPEEIESEHPLYILYTSGTTGKPKGIVHDTGGYMTLLHATMKWVFDIKDTDVYWCTADIGWVTGHSYIVFGPLMEGVTEVMYEGAPDYPTPDRWWRIVERYGVTILYTSPTAIRTFMRYGDDWVKGHDFSTIRILHSVGEPINPEAWKWAWKWLGRGSVPFGSTWWMTETGGILISHAPGLALIPLKPGTNGLPLPGIDADVVDDEGKPVQGKRGYLVIKKPWPGMLMTIWGDPNRYIQVYWSRFPGMYYAGDWAIKDEDGYIWVLGRADEVIKVSGHRLGTYEIESALVSHKAVAESAVVGVPDPVRGEVPVAFVVLKSGVNPSQELVKELRNWVRTAIGPIAEPANIVFVSKLPKTRSGKIMRRLLKQVLMKQPLGDTTTLEDETSIDEAKKAYEELARELNQQG